MDSRPKKELQEDSSPENRQLEKHLRKLGRILPGSPSFDWQESRGRCSEVLTALIPRYPCNRRLIEMLDGAHFLRGGDEHLLLEVEKEPQRIYKFTHGDNFGCRSYFSVHDPEGRGQHFYGTGNADPHFYLNRWRLLNSLGQYQTRFEGIVPSPHPRLLPVMCISQPILPGQNPTEAEIRSALAIYGFREICEYAFLREDNSILLTDVAPRNVRIVGRNSNSFRRNRSNSLPKGARMDSPTVTQICGRTPQPP